MEKLIKIAGQQFYYSSIKDIVDQGVQNQKCAIILNGADLDVLLESPPVFKNGVNQLIIIEKNLNSSITKLQGEDILLLAADNFDEAIRLAILSVELNNNIICSLEGSKDKVEEVMEELLA